MRFPRACLRILSSLALIGCFAGALSGAAPKTFSSLPPEEARAWMKHKDSDPRFRVIDVRPPAEFATGAFLGAVNIDISAPDFAARIDRLDRSAPYLVVCDGGTRSATAMLRMQKAGFQDVINLSGGLRAWRAEKLPLGASQAQEASAACPASPVLSGSSAWLAGRTRASIPFRLRNNHVHIEAEVNATRKLDLVLDTGMPMSGVLLVGAGAIHGLDLTYSGAAMIGGAGGGRVEAGAASGLTLRFGDLLLKEQTAVVHAPDPLPASSDPFARDPYLDAHGIIGYALFGRFVVGIDYDRMVITLSDPETFRYAGPGSRLPMTFTSNFPFVEATAQLEDGKRLPMTLLVDLGSSNALSLVLGAGTGITLPARTIAGMGKGFGGGKLPSQTGRIRELKLGDQVLSNVVATFSPDPTMPLEREGALGGQVLQRFQVFFDYPHRTMILEPGARFGKPFETGMGGFRATRTAQGDLVVEHVVPGSPAAEEGLAEDDRIVEMNGRPVSEVSLDDLRLALLQEGATLRLTLHRGDTRMARALKLRRLI